MEKQTNDYDLVKHTLAFISENWREQPSLETLADQAGLSPTHLQRLFTRWAGLSPKAFLQAVTLDHARGLLRDSASILDASYELGLSGPGRLHDLFVTHEGMSPGIYKAHGRGLSIRYGFHDCPFGRALILITSEGLAGLAFADHGKEKSALADMTSRWPEAAYVEDQQATASYARRIFEAERWQPDQPLKIVFIGTDFEIRVWETILRIPFGKASTYSDIACHIGKPKAARAVGTAVGKNPISFVVPCHRVLEKSGGLGGYHWGLTRKRAILGWEAGAMAA
ncbi:MAG TPA: bifunctional helix-turn-helix domain-containing protein/methylated-DNA--[protein]-cysteine S-methyltransferase [Aestuariivirga sp.]|jgi:AraC family transcriptional regulator of adaptative response/methylated-DNA-[protein]-cysteine methyltransferase|nr:bifunctional helix-turn-helix domain-containing protein/methylated-DNA--[protein]-cysteine S-methyltransferase [Hyphomicrobiales bacterium]MBP9174941.1 bifunctional helix-turn-helix domain-containing protein/methylated-DNA--[protein]-cysteine S-methyltransferase [Hyphomicrobiales bacterium]HQY73256.1 bifunctional helix-turn-helix domain-containing protein/methylated-DNA--[protein]-cysteine S-methyltransferase [Aestuariivirga sp.]HRA93414.1 bifunctional helix-turn-helix domain-containing prote